MKVVVAGQELVANSLCVVEIVVAYEYVEAGIGSLEMRLAASQTGTMEVAHFVKGKPEPQEVGTAEGAQVLDYWEIVDLLEA